jgi:hypothetical protein
VLGAVFTDRQAQEAQSGKRHWCENHAVWQDTDLVLLVTMVSSKENIYLSHSKDGARWSANEVKRIRCWEGTEGFS